MHGEVRKEDDKILLHPDDEACVSLIATSDNLHVVPHSKVFSQLVCRELQRILQVHTDRHTQKDSLRQQNKFKTAEEVFFFFAS